MSSLTSTEAVERVWYREPWPWIVIGLPLIAVVFSCYAAYLAVSGADTVVDNNYYRHGLAINEQLASARKAADLGLNAALQAPGLQPGDEVDLNLGAIHDLPDDATLTLRLEHPTRPSADRVAVLARRPGVAGAQFIGHWQPAEKVAAAVAWRVVIEGRGWRLEGDGPSTAGAFGPLTLDARQVPAPKGESSHMAAGG